MANNNEKERKTLERKLIDEGVIAALYTEKGWFVKIYPAYKIDKVKFSFVKKGEKGAGFDVYCSLPKFDLLCDDILSFRLPAKMEADRTAKKQYPEAWVHTTGENASKSVKIGHGNSGVLIQGGTKTPKAQFANVPCKYDDLRLIAKWFKRTSEKWFETAATELVENSEKYRNSLADDDEIATAPVAEEPQVNPPKAENQVPAEAPKQPADMSEFHTIQITSFDNNDVLGGVGVDESGKPIKFTFTAEVQAFVQSKMAVNAFRQAYLGRKLTVKASIVGNVYTIKGLATA